MVSASCPNCNIILVEANNADFSDLGIAEVEAVTLGATIVSNSYSGSGGIVADYDTPHITYLASSGDSGYGVADPADFDSVVSVGGTTLVQGGGGRGWTETVWNGTGGGCSNQPKPAWQSDTGCSHRTANDVSADANPNTGAAEYDTYGEAGWIQVGGTSLSSPLLAGVFGLAGNSTQQNGGQNFWVHASVPKPSATLNLWYISVGNDGTCSPTYLCTAGTREFGNYSGPAGWGTPNGIGAF